MKSTLAAVIILACVGCADRKFGFRPDGMWASGNTKYTTSDMDANAKMKDASLRVRGKQDPDADAIVATGQAVAIPIDAVGHIIVPASAFTLQQPVPSSLLPTRAVLNRAGLDLFKQK